MSGFEIKTRFDKRRRTAGEALKGYVFEQLKTTWRDCIRAFIMAASRRVVIDTGMSRASFYGVASQVKLGGDIMRDVMGQSRGPKRTYVDIHGTVHHGVQKSATMGKFLSQEPGEAYDIQFGTPETPDLLFKFNIVVFQYKLREKGFRGESAWDSLAVGKTAFLETWATVFPQRIKTRDISEFLKPR